MNLPAGMRLSLEEPWDGLMRGDWKKGGGKGKNGERILVQMTHRILIDNTDTCQYENIVTVSQTSWKEV